jgi:TfoX/Sxy family transcriptional regulator of competence genes
MASDQSFVDFVCEQANMAGRLSYKKMFGEYALYLEGKVVALVCDNQLFIKPTAEGKRLLRDVEEHPPYPNAKPHYRIGDELDDSELLRRVLMATADALPTPKPKTAKKVAAKKAR